MNGEMRNAKILLVEPNEEAWDFLSRRLKRHGYEVLLARESEAALDCARTGTPDLVLLDVNVMASDGVMDGWTVARTVRADPLTKTLPIIALQSHAVPGDREKAIQAGCTGYHPKPIDFAKLLTQIEEALDSQAIPSAPA